MREPDAEARAVPPVMPPVVDLDPGADFIYVFDEAEFVIVRTEPWPAGATDGEPT